MVEDRKGSRSYSKRPSLEELVEQPAGVEGAQGALETRGAEWLYPWWAAACGHPGEEMVRAGPVAAH